jgi:hypothetical protein
MKTKAIHKSNLGFFSALIKTDFHGYIECHDSPRYGRMAERELQRMAEEHPMRLIRNAAKLELANRLAKEWAN